MSNILVIFDIDGTLVGSYGWTMWARPHLKELFKFCFENFNSIGIWSAAKKTWVKMVYGNIFQPMLAEINTENNSKYEFAFMYNEKYTTMEPDTYIVRKPLSIIWERTKFTKHNTLIIDDYPETFRDNIENGILMPSLEAMSEKECSNDKWLLYLIEFLKHVLVHYTQENTVETIDKSGWWKQRLS